MNDNALINAVRTVLLAGLAANSQSDVLVAQDYQPDQQGISNSKIIYIHKIADNRYGFTQKKDVDNSVDFTHTETQQMETSFQLSARMPVSVTVGSISPADVLNLAAMILQSDVAQASLQALGIGIYRVAPVRHLIIVNDFNRNEASPSFDIILTHKRSITGNIPAVDTFESNLRRV